MSNTFEDLIFLISQSNFHWSLTQLKLVLPLFSPHTIKIRYFPLHSAYKPGFCNAASVLWEMRNAFLRGDKNTQSVLGQVAETVSRWIHKSRNSKLIELEQSVTQTSCCKLSPMNQFLMMDLQTAHKFFCELLRCSANIIISMIYVAQCGRIKVNLILIVWMNCSFFCFLGSHLSSTEFLRRGIVRQFFNLFDNFRGPTLSQNNWNVPEKTSKNVVFEK